MWTNEDLQRLEKAISLGTLKVKFADKEVTYQDISEMLKARSTMLRVLRQPTLKTNVISTFDKGL